MLIKFSTKEAIKLSIALIYSLNLFLLVQKLDLKFITFFMNFVKELQEVMERQDYDYTDPEITQGKQWEEAEEDIEELDEG